MKAAVLKDIENLEIEEIKEPEPEENEIVIKVEACAICGTDIKVYHYGHKHIHNKIALDILASGKINCENYITHRFPLEKIKEGLKIVEERKGLKVLILPGKEV